MRPGGGSARTPCGLLHLWCDDSKGPRYCALLGEYGIGKTTTAKKLAAERKEKQLMTIYLDLRLVAKEEATQNIELTKILDLVLTKSWKSGRQSAALKAAEAIKQVREQGALVMFDGLDEVLVHLSPQQGQHFTRELFRILPPALASRGKMLAAAKLRKSLWRNCGLRGAKLAGGVPCLPVGADGGGESDGGRVS